MEQNPAAIPAGTSPPYPQQQQQQQQQPPAQWAYPNQPSPSPQPQQQQQPPAQWVYPNQPSPSPQPQQQQQQQWGMYNGGQPQQPQQAYQQPYPQPYQPPQPQQQPSAPGYQQPTGFYTGDGQNNPIVKIYNRLTFVHVLSWLWAIIIMGMSGAIVAKIPAGPPEPLPHAAAAFNLTMALLQLLPFSLLEYKFAKPRPDDPMPPLPAIIVYGVRTIVWIPAFAVSFASGARIRQLNSAAEDLIKGGSGLSSDDLDDIANTLEKRRGGRGGGGGGRGGGGGGKSTVEIADQLAIATGVFGVFILFGHLYQLFLIFTIHRNKKNYSDSQVRSAASTLNPKLSEKTAA